MELWIRSQNRESLIKVNKVCFERNIDDEPTIYGYENYDNYDRLGIYKTKERALEVLDEIEKILMPKTIIKNEGREMYGLDGHIYRTNILSSAKTDIQELSTYVYKMPKE